MPSSFTHELVDLPSGLALETSLYVPELHGDSTSSEDKGLIVCLHPWSRLGGYMDDGLLSDHTDLFVREHKYHVLRYNSRGVGKSSGWASFNGLTEGDDLKELVQWALRTISSVKSLVLLGYSHGSLITTLHPVLPPEIKTSHILLSYPLGARPFLTLFNSNIYAQKLQDLLRDSRSNVLVIYGNRDEFTSDSRYGRWVEELKKDRTEDRLRVVRVEGANHFWGGRFGPELAGIISDWLPSL